MIVQTSEIQEKQATRLPTKKEGRDYFFRFFKKEIIVLGEERTRKNNHVPFFPKVLLMDCRWFAVCPMKRFYEEGKLDKKWIDLYCKGDWESCVRYQLEERGELHPDWMLPDGSIDKRLVNYIGR